MGGRLELRTGRVHEVVARTPGDAASRIFAAGVAGRRTGPCLWITRRHLPLLCPHGLRGLLDPGLVILARTDAPLDGLWTAEEGLRSGAFGTVVLESDQPLSLFQSRRLQLAAEAGGALGLFVGPRSGNTAAETRWDCRALPGDARHRSGLRVIRFDWRQTKNKRGPVRDWKAVRDEAAGDLHMVAASGGGACPEERARPGPPAGDRLGGQRRLEALLAQHGSAESGADLRHGAG